jgi:hypothetical protein
MILIIHAKVKLPAAAVTAVENPISTGLLTAAQYRFWTPI